MDRLYLMLTELFNCRQPPILSFSRGDVSYAFGDYLHVFTPIYNFAIHYSE